MDKLVHSPGVDQIEERSGTASVSLSERVEQATGFLRRQSAIVVFVLACALAVGGIYLLVTPPLYTAHTLLMLDTSKMRASQQQTTIGDLTTDAAQVDTQVELLKSATTGLSVIKALKLTEDSEFVGRRASFLGRMFGLITQLSFSAKPSAPTTLSEDELTRRALGRYLTHRYIKRVGRTYVIDISYTSLSPARAAAVANGIAEAYILDQLEAKYQAQRRASNWMQERVAELRLQTLAADRALLEFRENKNIFGVSGGSVLLAEQQVADLSSQLATARAAKFEAAARLERIQQVMKQEVPDATVADSLRNDIINKLRAQYLDYDRTYTLWATKYGPSHLAAVNLRTQMNQLSRSMQEELGRIAESYKSDYEIAKAREDALQKGLAELISGAQLVSRDRLGMNELESSAKAYHSIHDSFLQRYMEMTQQISYPITEARVISATSRGGKTEPQISAVLTMAAALGLMLGIGAGFLRESLDRVFRTTRQIETILKTNCLAILPLLKIVAAPAVAGSKRSPPLTPTDAKIDPNVPRLYRHVIHEPLSPFTEGFRAIKVAADISGMIRENKVIGVTSSLPREGKSTVASNLAELIAHGGSKVILVDADLRNPTITRRLAPDAEVGLLQVLAGKVGLSEAFYSDNDTGLVFLPAVIESHLAHSSEILASDAFRRLVDELRTSYDYIIMDLPPLAPVVDVRATTRTIDSYVFVVEWARTRIDMVEHQLGSAPELFERLLGVVLNKANMKIIDRYGNGYDRYYNKYYAGYGYTH